MRVLGIDCGTERTGYGVIDSDGRTHSLISAGVIRTNTKSPLETRLLEICHQLRNVIARDDPKAAAVEEVFYSTNVKTALKLAHVRGVALLEIKTSVVGYGRAEKHQVQVMVTSLLRLEEPIESEDACDALAVAMCHATRRGLEHHLEGSRS
jgi:crossover junction endodeoxyribonuclease RuvC